MDKIRVLFVCVHNSARSQMAEKFLNALGEGRFSAESAGLEPGTLNPLAVKVMAEIGYDISKNQTKSVFDIAKSGKSFDYVITVCDPEAAERCPMFPGKAKKLNWEFKDPSSFTGSEEEKLAQTRKVRDEIKEKVLEFMESVEGKVNEDDNKPKFQV